MERGRIGNRKQRRAAARQAAGAPAELFAAAQRRHRAGELGAAERFYRQILAIDPRHDAALHLLGVLAHQIGRQDAALDLIGKAIALNPRDPAYHSNLGLVLQQQGRLDEAVASFGRALDLAPEDAELHCNLGVALQQQMRLSNAVAAYERALDLAPNMVEAHNNLGIALKEQGRLEEAVASYRRALALKPSHADAHSNLGLALQEQGRLEEAVACYRQALLHRPDFLAVRSNLLFTLNYAGMPSALCLEEARRYGALARRKVTAPLSSSARDAAPQRLRVGLVSGDLCTHPVAYFLESLMARLDGSRLELVAYPTQPRSDAVTGRLRACCADWKPIFGMSDEAAARLIHGDGIHILIDLAGHTAENRLPVFAWKPAPVQVSWLGYFATTGLAEIDWLLADRIVAPPADDAHFTERVWRLPETYRCFTPPDIEIEPGPPPCLASGAVTFGCFNNLAKLTDEVIELWARLLAAVPDAGLFLKAKQLTGAAVCDVMRARFAAHGIAADRLDLEGHSPRPEMLAAYRRVDVALDPFPYPGGTTSMEALWMGVPVVTRSGATFLARGGESILRNAGLPFWIAESDEAYLAKAIAAAENPASLAGLRAGLRRLVLASPMCDASRFGENFEAALWGMWEARTA